MMPPCKNCCKRKINCHASCDPYNKYVAERKRIAKNRSLENQAEGYFSERRKDKMDIIYKKMQKGLKIK